MLWMYRVDPPGFSVCMLRGVNDRVFNPELLDPIDDDASPYFAKSFNEGEGTNVVDGDVLKYFRQRAEFTPFPRWEGGSLLPEDYEMIIESTKVKSGKRCNHVVCETGGSGRGLRGHSFQGVQKVRIRGSGTKLI